MIVVPHFLEDGNLQLDAFSFSDQELESVANTIESMGLPFESFDLKPDEFNRKGKGYFIFKEYVRQFLLNIGPPLMHYKSIRPPLMEGKGKTYKCEELTLSGKGGDCANLRAKDSDQATVKCALVAHQNQWMGGVASPGKCN